MRRYYYSKLYRLKFLLCSALVLLAQTVCAAPGFDLDLKELKKPSIPLAIVKKKTVAVQNKKKAEKKTVQQKKPAMAKPLPAVAVEHNAVKPVVLANTEASELALHLGGNACQLAEHVAIAVARAVPATSLLNGLSLQPVASVKYAELGLMVVCGISPAEAYTYSRLLEEHHVELVNITGSETAGQTAQKIIDALAISYRIETAAKPSDGTLTYLIPASQERQRPLRLTLHP